MADIREAIDILDQDIVAAIAKRAKYVHMAAKFKKNPTAVKDEKRVQEVIASKKLHAEQFDVSSELIEKLYALMIDHFIEEELERWKTLGN